MWMCYSAQSWPEATSIETGVNRLASQFSDIIFDREHALNYDLNVCYDEARSAEVMGDVYRHMQGSTLCEMFREKKININQFCDRLVAAGLKKFLFELTDFLPADIITQHDLSECYRYDLDDGGENKLVIKVEKYLVQLEYNDDVTMCFTHGGFIQLLDFIKEHQGCIRCDDAITIDELIHANCWCEEEVAEITLIKADEVKDVRMSMEFMNKINVDEILFNGFRIDNGVDTVD